MPQKIAGPHKIEEVSPRLFLYSNGCWSYFPDEPVHPNELAAERHWARARREVWGLARRGNPPGAASYFDRLTRSSLELLRTGWGLRTFPLAEILAAVAEDRAAVARWRAAAPAAARAIDDFLGDWLADLDTVAAEARRIAEERSAGVRFPARPEIESPWHYGA